MNDYMLIFRADYSPMQNSTDEQKKAATQRWMDWIKTFADRDRLVSIGNRLQPSGRTVSAGQVITNGPHTELKEFIGGFSVVRADDYDEVVSMVKDCPVFGLGGKVEIREISVLK